ncbi:MAG: PLP-dependent aminotransferase family protein [Balneolaceae bacterium]|nr:PLP-dependent aminotransferase family protein [Balneolaceae bacterium]
MKLLQELIQVDKEADQAVYLQITNAFIRNIRRGKLRKELKLPGSRKIAGLLRVNRMTVVAAFDELRAQGWIERIPRKGTFIRKDLPDIQPESLTEDESVGYFPDTTSFHLDAGGEDEFPTMKRSSSYKLEINDGFPDIRMAPADHLFRTMRSLSKREVFKKYLKYGGPHGTNKLRKVLALHLRDTRGLPVSKENILITRGAQMALFLISELLLKSGDQVIVGEPGYFGANRTFKRRGAKLHYVPVDEKGIDVDTIEQICKKHSVRLVYAIPHHHHPTTVTLAPERRLHLLELAARYNFAIVEDDYDYDFHYASRPVQPMASLDQSGNVIYAGTFTKTLAPAIRLGFVVGARNLIDALAQQRRAVDWQGDHLMEAAIAELFKDGTIGRHIKKSVKLYKQRRDHFCELLHTHLKPHINFSIPDGGMSVWVAFKDVSLPELSERTAENGLRISDGRVYNTHEQNYNSLRMGFASLDKDEQVQAVNILRQSLKNI